MNFHESADRDFSIQFCEYNYSNPDYDQIYRPNGSGDYLFLLFKTPMKVYLDKKLNISKENTVMIGDTCIDIKTGKNAGIKTIGCLWGFRTLEELVNAGADYIADKPLDIVKYLCE